MINNVEGNIHFKTPVKDEKVDGSETTELDFKIDIPVTKVWNDENNTHRKRPEEIDIVLKRNGTENQRFTLDSSQQDENENTWKKKK